MPVDFASFAAVLRSLDVAGSVRELPEPAPTAATAAAQLGCEVGAIANSLIFSADGAPLLVMTSGAHRVDTARVAALTGASVVARADARSVREWTGQAIGGVAPVGHPAPIRTLVDVWLDKYDEVWAAAGHPHTVFPTSFGELIRITSGTAADVGDLSVLMLACPGLILGLSWLVPQQRVAPQHVPAVARARQQPGRLGPDLAPAQLRIHDGCPGSALAVDGPVPQAGRHAGGADEEVGQGFVCGQADDGEPATRPQQPGHGGQRGGEVHVVQRGVGAGEVEAGRLERVGQEVGLDERGPAAVAGPGQGDHPRVTVDAGH